MNDTVMPEDMNQMGQEINEGTTNVDSHTSNTNNPHSVTKEQVGLGNVDNFETASQAEAEAGTATDKFMTPQGTAQAIGVLVTTDSIGAASQAEVDDHESRISAIESLGSGGKRTTRFVVGTSVSGWTLKDVD